MSPKPRGGWSTTPMLMPKGGSASTRVTVPHGALHFGRDPGCEVVVAEPTVSRRHAALHWDGHELVVEDLGSSGGTFVNGEAVRRATLHPGDVLRLGPRVEYVAEDEAAQSVLEVAARQSSGENSVHHLQAMLEVARALNAATVLEEVVALVLQAAVRMLHADRGCVILLEGGERRTVACHPHGTPGGSWAAHNRLFDRALNERRAVHGGVEQAPTTSMVARGAAMTVAAPLLVAHRPLGPAKDASFVATVEVIGGLMVERTHAGRQFGQEEMAVLESLAADAALAIDGARLYREARQKAKIDHEMGLARGIQTAMLRSLPQLPFAETFAFSQPARIVGGDLYHGASRENGTLAVALGDVSGKGVPAALIMAMVQGLLGLLDELGQPLAAMLPALNRSLLEHNPGNRFVTLGTGVLAADGALELANAGHCPIAIVRRGGEVELCPPGGPVLGLLPSAAWGTETERLAPGDAVVLYSDGVSESFSPADEEFGLDGVRRALTPLVGASAEAMGQGLLAAAAAHRAGREAEDDETVLVVRYAGNAEVKSSE